MRLGRCFIHESFAWGMICQWFTVLPRPPFSPFIASYSLNHSVARLRNTWPRVERFEDLNRCATREKVFSKLVVWNAIDFLYNAATATNGFRKQWKKDILVRKQKLKQNWNADSCLFCVCLFFLFFFIPPSIYFPYPLLSEIEVTEVSWSISQLSSGKGRVTPFATKMDKNLENNWKPMHTPIKEPTLDPI